MKKILTLAMTIVMVLTFAVSVFAADSVDVNVTIDTDGAPATTYFIVVAWENADFTYHVGADRDWITDEGSVHGYANNTGTGWGDARATSVTGTVKVSNHSDAPIKVTAEVKTDAAEISGVNVVISDNANTPTDLAMPEIGSAWDTAPSTTYTCTVSGTPSAEGKAATIKVTIA